MNNNDGEEILDPDTVSQIHEKLAHLCSEKEENFQGSLNGQHLEECDTLNNESSALIRLDSNTHEITHQISLSCSQWLFKINYDSAQIPAICCRNDVDACVWQLKEGNSSDKNWPYEHLGTFFAFGYVQASKTEKKFLASAPNLSYVVVCETSRHIYIYRQPSLLTSELKNRHTGQRIKKISKQQLVNLNVNQQVQGLYATNDILYVLLENSVMILIINE